MQKTTKNAGNRGFCSKSRVWAKIAKFVASVESRFPGGTGLSAAPWSGPPPVGTMQGRRTRYSHYGIELTVPLFAPSTP